MYYFNLYVGLGVLLITVLAMNISRLRFKENIAIGDGGNVDLKKAIRAHINSLEHIIPFGFIVLVLAQLDTGAPILLAATMGFILVRILHSYSMLSASFKLRQLSAGLTYTLEVLGCVTILYKLSFA